MPNANLQDETGRASPDRAVYRAMFELLEGNLALYQTGEIEVETAEGRYRFIDGICFGAPDEDRVGASLVGWLVESERASAVLTRWRRGSRAVLAREGAKVHITGSTCALVVGGTFVDEGFATHEGRLVFAHEALVPRSLEDAAPEIEIHGDVELSEAEAAALAEEARSTAPPSEESGSLLALERARAAVLAERFGPSSPRTAGDAERTDARPPSHAAPPAWQLPPVPAIGPLPPLPMGAAEADEAEGLRRAEGLTGNLAPE